MVVVKFNTITYFTYIDVYVKCMIYTLKTIGVYVCLKGLNNNDYKTSKLFNPFAITFLEPMTKNITKKC